MSFSQADEKWLFPLRLTTKGPFLKNNSQFFLTHSTRVAMCPATWTLDRVTFLGASKLSIFHLTCKLITYILKRRKDYIGNGYFHVVFDWVWKLEDFDSGVGQPLNLAVGGSITDHKGVQVIIPGTWKYVASHGKQELKLKMEFRLLTRWP